MNMQSRNPDLALAAAFARRVIGSPWRESAYGPDAFDCWGLTHTCQKEVFGRDIPVINHPGTLRALIETMERSDVHDTWPEVSEPDHGDIVTMTHGQHPHHIGVWLALDGGRVLHCTRDEGVMCCSRVQLKLEGFRRLRFHHYTPRGLK